MDDRPILYQGCAVVMQEVPDEISLAFNIAGCPHRCEGCHTPELQEYKGEPLSENFVRELDAHPGITCVCFLGGDTFEDELFRLCEEAHKRGLVTCFYSGCDDWLGTAEQCPNYQGFEAFDYIKSGHYDKGYGPLTSPTTNQRMYRVEGASGARHLEDITWRFWKTYE